MKIKFKYTNWESKERALDGFNSEMDSEYPFLFCSKSCFWMEIPDDRENGFKKTKRQTSFFDVCLQSEHSVCTECLYQIQLKF